MPGMTITKFIKRFDKVKPLKENFRSLLQDAYEFALPQRNIFDSPAPGQRKGDRVFDSTAPTSLIKFANLIQTRMLPPFTKWAILEPGPMVPDEMREEAKRVLDAVSETMFAVFQASNFDLSANEMLLDLGIGTGAMQVVEGPLDMPVEYNTAPIARVYLEEGPNGSIIGVYQVFKIKVGLLEMQWPDIKLTKSIEDMIAKDDTQEIEVVDGAYLDIKTGKWYYDVIYTKEKNRLVRRIYDLSPWVTPRWIKVAGEPYGRGPIIQALADIKTLNKLVELILKNASLAVSGVYTGVSGGSYFNPTTVVIAPGAVIPVDSNGGARGPDLMPLRRSADFSVGDLLIDRLQASIKKFLLDKGLPEETGAVKSATEIIARLRELQTDIGSPFGRLMREFIVPVVQRTLDIMHRRGLGPKIVVDGLRVKVSVVSPLAREQKINEVETLVNWLQMIGGTLGEEIMMMGAVVEDIPAWMGEQLGIPQKLIRDKDQRKQMQQLVGQLLAQQQQESQAVPAAANDGTVFTPPGESIPVQAAA